MLGIETSCDETAVALYHPARGLVADLIHSQVVTHKGYGGVVPELASRDHLKKMLPLIQQLLYQSGVSPQDISGIAYTKGPGLMGALMVGATVAHGLAYAWNCPIIGVHHIEAHLMATMLEEEKPDYPFIGLVISGGHTLLLRVDALGCYQILGETLDDAVGEAFDKTGTLLGLSYPGGPVLSRLAQKGNPNRFYFPRPMSKQSTLNFSFSGLKTAALHCIRSNSLDSQTRADIACAFEEAVVDTLLIKSRRALREFGINTLVVVGGVSANRRLRESLFKMLKSKVFFPRHVFCTDNAAMVAYTGWCRRREGKKASCAIEVKPRWSMASMACPVS